MGFHIFAGSQVLKAEGITGHLRGALDQAMRAADILGIAPEIFNLGGGFGIPYGPQDTELDLAAVGAELDALQKALPPLNSCSNWVAI